MTFLDVVKLAGAIMASIGGAGAIIFGLSGFLGKLWADRALENQRHQLDAALRRVQVELDTLGLVHSLRTKEEFTLLAQLWKYFANLSATMRGSSGMGLLGSFTAAEEEFDKQKAERWAEFPTVLDVAEQFFYGEEVFIPEPIASVASKAFIHANNYKNVRDFIERTGERGAVDLAHQEMKQFNVKLIQLDQLIRKHIRGESLGKTESSELSDPKSGPSE